MNVKTVIFCGGKGTRMKEETEFKPKPMVTIGDQPILWHIMKIYAHHGYKEFVLPLGYKGHLIKDYFLNSRSARDGFKIAFADTGEETATGERLLSVKRQINGEVFMVTYGDGVGDIDIKSLLDFHRRQKTIGTITAAHPSSKYGLLGLDKKGGLVTSFRQKPVLKEYINVGFMVFNKEIFDYLSRSPIEDTLERLAKARQLSVYVHGGFWKAMDTYAEMEELNNLWASERPWAIWEN